MQSKYQYCTIRSQCSPQCRPPKIDYRTRRDRVERRNRAWEVLYDDIMDAYLHWDHVGPPVNDSDSNIPLHTAVTLYSMQKAEDVALPYNEKDNLCVTMARHGWIATAPQHPSRGFSTDLLEMFRCMNRRCPGLSIQAFVRAMCDQQRVSCAHVSTYTPADNKR